MPRPEPDPPPGSTGVQQWFPQETIINPTWEPGCCSCLYPLNQYANNLNNNDNSNSNGQHIQSSLHSWVRGSRVASLCPRLRRDIVQDQGCHSSTWPPSPPIPQAWVSLPSRPGLSRPWDAGEYYYRWVRATGLLRPGAPGSPCLFRVNAADTRPQGPAGASLEPQLCPPPGFR